MNSEITGKSSREQVIGVQYVFVFSTIIPFALWILTSIFPTGYRERIELAVPLIAAVLSFGIGSLTKTRAGEPLGRIKILVVVATTATIAFQTAISGNGKFPYLWNGFGIKLVLFSLLVAVLMLTPVPYWLLTQVQSKTVLTMFLTSVGLIVIFFFYLPSFIQPPWGIINIGDATHQVLEEISGPFVGNFPGVNAVSTYTTMLGVPLTFLRLFDLGNQTKMALVLIWVNLLVLAAPVFMVLTFRLISKSKNWFWSTMVVVPILMVSGSWSAASSNTESLSMIPGRTLLPIVLGYFLVKTVRLDDWKGNMRGAAFLGILGVIVAMNNIEFGVPALGAMVMVSLILALQLQGTVRFFCYLVVGAAVGFLLFVGYSLSIKGPYNLDFRIGSYAGKPYSPAELFPILSLHNVLLALFGSAIASGIMRLRNINLGNKTDGLVAAVCALYFGVWGFASFPYCSYRCVDGLYMSTQVYLIPAIMSGAALCILQLPKLEVLRSENFWEKMSHTLYFFIASFVLVSVLQAPNPIDEWNRILNRARGEQWASDPLRGPANEWSVEEIDWVTPIEISDLARKVNSNDIGYFGYMGNSVELATGINNLTRINSGEVLLIKGTNRLNELACVGVDETRPKFVVVYGIEFICEGYSPFDQATSSVPGLGVYTRDG